MNKDVSSQAPCSFFIGILTCLVAIAPVFSGQMHPISYSEAVRLALNNNPDFKSNSTKIEAAQATVIEKQGARLPKLNLELNAARSNNPLNVFGYKLSQGNASFADFGAAQFTGPESLYVVPSALNNPGYYNNFDTGFNLSVPLYAGGEKIARIKQARDLLNAARHGNSAARSKLAYDILLAYEGVLATEEVIAVTKKGAATARNFLNMTQRLKQQSLALESDVLLAESYLQTSLSSVETASLEWQNHVDEFRMLLGLPESNVVPGYAVHFTTNIRRLNTLVNTALVNNPHLKELKSNVEAQAAHIAAVKSDNLPKINLQLRQDWNGNTLGSGYPSNLIGLQMNWLLFSSGERTGIERKAIAEMKQARYQMDDTANQLKLSLQKARRSEQLADIQYRTHQKNTLKAKKMVRFLESRYGRGLVPLGQLIESHRQLIESLHQKIVSQYNKTAAHGRLLLLTNELIQPVPHVLARRTPVSLREGVPMNEK